MMYSLGKSEGLMSRRGVGEPFEMTIAKMGMHGTTSRMTMQGNGRIGGLKMG